MSLILHNMPDDVAKWPDWLECRLVSPTLGQLVAELEVVHGGSLEAEATLDEVCGEALREVYSIGLAALSPERLRMLLRQPSLLLALQEAVLIHGQSYWTAVPRPYEFAQSTDEQWRQVATTCGLADTPAQAGEADSRMQPELATHHQRRSRRTWITSVAALVLVGTGIWFVRPRPAMWGFDRDGLLSTNVPRDEYLNALADAAGDWFNKRPDQVDGLVRRLTEFERGCDTLIQAPHPELADVDRQWLVERCGAWKSKLAACRTSLSAGQLSLEEAQATADQTIRALQHALRTRASQETA